MINIYCDESCHLEKDNQKCMVLGAISCEKRHVKNICRELRKIKKEYGMSATCELKWTKVSSGKLEYYKKVIDYFVNNDNLSFRAVVAQKTHLRHKDFNQTHDEWYYKMYYLLLDKMVSADNEYRIFVDIKDTQGTKKVIKLKDIINGKLYTFADEAVKGIQQIRSHESELIQLSDFLIGAISYRNRELSSSTSKLELCKYLEASTGISITQKTSLNVSKFNIFIWNMR